VSGISLKKSRKSLKNLHIVRRLKSEKETILYFDVDDLSHHFILYFFHSSPEIFHICNVFVEKDFRGKGFGNKILEKAEKYSKKHGAKELRLTVEKRNKFAYDWYKRHGFEEISEYEEYPKRISMQKFLI
jgi:ribosomal protein S18 acetylase RimI-like enzyme